MAPKRKTFSEKKNVFLRILSFTFHVELQRCVSIIVALVFLVYGGNAGVYANAALAAFESIEALRTSARQFVVGDQIDLLGYWEINDGGGHRRVIGNEDRGGAIALGNLFANVIPELGGKVYLEWFGATAETTDSINIAWCAASKYSWVVANGKYRSTESLFLLAEKKYELNGTIEFVYPSILPLVDVPGEQAVP
ncbi:MAG: hypothetical protein WCG80_13600, partial [Spirochaetales bacterium]